jgi:hypothetical protein
MPREPTRCRASSTQLPLRQERGAATLVVDHGERAGGRGTDGEDAIHVRREQPADERDPSGLDAGAGPASGTSVPGAAVDHAVASSLARRSLVRC